MKIEKIHVQQQETLFHLQRLSRMVQLFVDTEECKVEKVHIVLKSALKQIENLTD